MNTKKGITMHTQNLDANLQIKCSAVTDSVVRLSVFKPGTSPGSALNRYGFINESLEHHKNSVRTKKTSTGYLIQSQGFNFSLSGLSNAEISLKNGRGKNVLKGKAAMTETGGFLLDFALDRDEKVYGFGDQTRERIEQRGSTADMWIKNVACYIPIPFMMSTAGYGIFVNTTFRHFWDIGKKDSNRWQLFLPEGNLDVYFVYGETLKDILKNYLELTGRSAFPPKWSFGLWFICHQYASEFNVMDDALHFRAMKIPCDIMGLEPGWMETIYDFTIEKKWHPERFPIPVGYGYTSNFIAALKRMGFKLELWLCNDYDLSYEAERRVDESVRTQKADEKHFFHKDDVVKDSRFIKPIMSDRLTKPEIPWFEHLKKFVGQGTELFKQDGSSQVNEHPDRLWGNGMRDNEMHNLYPLLYSQQMFDGFKEHTKRRPCCFTAAGWAGLQKYTGTWTGDTGGGPKTLVACLNLALSGHSLVTCDMDVTTKEGIHYGFLLPWAQINSWHFFKHPWYLGDELYPILCNYARFRSRLIPYLYTYAYLSHTEGLPIMRPLVLEFQGDAECNNILNEYLLGREMLVTAFDNNIYLPEGMWCDYWTGKMFEGRKRLDYIPPANRGGGLFIRENSIIPLGPVVDYVGQKTGDGYELIVFINPGGTAEFTLYDDDGVSFDYEKGRFKLIRFKAKYKEDIIHVQLSHEIIVDSITVHSRNKPDRILVNNKRVEYFWNKEKMSATINFKKT